MVDISLGNYDHPNQGIIIGVIAESRQISEAALLVNIPVMISINQGLPTNVMLGPSHTINVIWRASACTKKHQKTWVILDDRKHMKTPCQVPSYHQKRASRRVRMSFGLQIARHTRRTRLQLPRTRLDQRGVQRGAMSLENLPVPNTRVERRWCSAVSRDSWRRASK